MQYQFITTGVLIRARIGGGLIWSKSDHFFGAEGAEKLEKWAKVAHFAPQAPKVFKNLEDLIKFVHFCKNEDFIA